MSNNSSSNTKLTGYDFHSYLDGQISDEDFTRIEKSVSSHPKVILQMQQCIMISERFQSLFGEPVTGPLQTKQQTSGHPKLAEPALLNDDQFEESEEALVAVDALEIGNNRANNNLRFNNSFNQNDSWSNARHTDASVHPHQAQDFNSPAEEVSAYGEQYAAEGDYETDAGAGATYAEGQPEPYQNAAYTDDHYVAYGSEYSDGQHDRYETLNSEAIEPVEHSNDVIHVETLLQGISEVEALSQRQEDPLVGQIHGMKLYTHPDRGWFGNFIHSTKDIIRAKINLYRYKIQQKRLNKILQESEMEYENPPELTNEYEYNIDTDIQSQEPPKWQFWKSRTPKPNYADEIYYDEFNNPFSVANNSKIARLRDKAWIILNALHIPEHNHNQVLVGMLVFVSFVLGLLFGGNSISLDSSSIVYQAIDAHKYYATRGFEPLQQGLPNLNEDVTLFGKILGRKYELFDLKNTDFHVTGSTLLPSLNGYTNLLLFTNRNKENVTLLVTAWSDPDLENDHVSCKVPAGISSVCVWQDDDFYYVMSSDISLSRVRSFAENLALQERR